MRLLVRHSLSSGRVQITTMAVSRALRRMRQRGQAWSWTAWRKQQDDLWAGENRREHRNKQRNGRRAEKEQKWCRAANSGGKLPICFWHVKRWRLESRLGGYRMQIWWHQPSLLHLTHNMLIIVAGRSSYYLDQLIYSWGYLRRSVTNSPWDTYYRCTTDNIVIL
jgi:hypothetical protein